MSEDTRHRNTLCLQTVSGGAADTRSFDTLFASTQQELSAMASYLMSSKRGSHTL